MSGLTPEQVGTILTIGILVLVLSAAFGSRVSRWNAFQAWGQADPHHRIPDGYPQRDPYPMQVPREIVPRDTSPTSPAPPRRDGALPARLLEALHLLVIGHTSGGKTTLLHALACAWAKTGRVYVVDLDAAPGMWPGCEVVGAGDNLEAVKHAALEVKDLFLKRSHARASGFRGAFPPAYVIIDEYADVREVMRPIVEKVLRRGRKLGLHLVIGVQDKQVRTMGFEGASSLLINFSTVVECTHTGGRRYLTFRDPRGNEADDTQPTPTLPSPEAFVQVAQAQEPPTLSDDRGDAPSVQQNPAEPAETTPEVGTRAGDDEIIWVCTLNGRTATRAQVREALVSGRTEAQIMGDLFEINHQAGARYKEGLDRIAQTRAALLQP